MVKIDYHTLFWLILIHVIRLRIKFELIFFFRKMMLWNFDQPFCAATLLLSKYFRKCHRPEVQEKPPSF